MPKNDLENKEGTASGVIPKEIQSKAMEAGKELISSFRKQSGTESIPIWEQETPAAFAKRLREKYTDEISDVGVLKYLAEKIWRASTTLQSTTSSAQSHFQKLWKR